MAQTEIIADGLWTAFRALPRDSRDRFIQRMLADVTLRQELEDLLDLAVAQERAQEPGRSLEDVWAEIER